MNTFSLSHLSDQTLLRDLAALLARDRATTATLLAHLAEVDTRRLYLPAAYSSMYLYCVGELGLSEDSACKRIRAARVAQQFPALFASLADGRLNLSAVVMLAPYLAPENADELLAAAAHKSKAEIEQVLAERFPRPEVPTRLQAVAPSPPVLDEQLSPGTVAQSAPGRIEAPAPPPRVAPLAPQRFELRLTIDQSTHDDLRYAQALLSHQITSRDVAQVLGRALKALIGQLERRKFAATRRPRRGQRRPTAGSRYIPADVKRAVWDRDGGKCTFVSDAGHRCQARTLLEFDHVDPVARGGQATAGNMRLRCRAHNQYEAERAFGADFMSHKRQAAQHAAAAARAKAAAAEQAKERDVMPWLRRLGFRADEARAAAALCETIPDASLKERVRMALSFFSPRSTSPKGDPARISAVHNSVHTRYPSTHSHEDRSGSTPPEQLVGAAE